MRLSKDPVFVVLGLALLGAWVLFGAAVWLRPTPQARDDLASFLPQDREFRLGDSPSDEVYGFGEGLGVTTLVKHPSRFVFGVPAGPAPKLADLEGAVGVPAAASAPRLELFFESKEIVRRKQLIITLNGRELGWAKEDAAFPERAPHLQRILLPAESLVPGGTNELVFFNTGLSSGADRWALSRACVSAAVPAKLTADLLREATAAFAYAQGLFAAKGEALENRFLAWTEMRETLALIDGITPVPQLRFLIEAKLREVDAEFEEICEKALFAGKRAEARRDRDGALKEYDRALKFFPLAKEEPPCRARLG